MVFIEFDKADSELTEAFSKFERNIIEKFETKNFDLDSNTIALLIAVSPVIVTELARVITSAIEKKKNIKVKLKGMEFEGLSKEDVIGLLQELAGASEGAASATEEKAST